MENDEFSVTPLNTNKYLLAFVRVVWCEKTVVRHTFCRHKHTRTHTTSQSTLWIHAHTTVMEMEKKKKAKGTQAVNGQRASAFGLSLATATAYASFTERMNGKPFLMPIANLYAKTNTKMRRYWRWAVAAAKNKKRINKTKMAKRRAHSEFIIRLKRRERTAKSIRLKSWTESNFSPRRTHTLFDYFSMIFVRLWFVSVFLSRLLRSVCLFIVFRFSDRIIVQCLSWKPKASSTLPPSPHLRQSNAYTHSPTKNDAQLSNPQTERYFVNEIRPLTAATMAAAVWCWYLTAVALCFTSIIAFIRHFGIVYLRHRQASQLHTLCQVPCYMMATL